MKSMIMHNMWIKKFTHMPRLILDVFLRNYYLYGVLLCYWNCDFNTHCEVVVIGIDDLF